MSRPLGDHALDGAVVAFAGWTVVCQAAVVAGGSAWTVLASGGLAALGALGGWLRWSSRERPAAGPPTPRLEGRQARGQIEDDDRPGTTNAAWSDRAAPLLAVVAAMVASVLVHLQRPRAVVTAGVGLVLKVTTGLGDSEPARVTGARWLTVLCAIVAMMATATFNRSDADDAFYLGVANAVADRPSGPVLRDDTLHGVPGLEIPSRHHRVRTFEVAIGALSLSSGIAPVVWAHWLLPPFVAIGLVLAHRRLLRHVVPDRWPWALAATMVVLLTIGDAHAWHGNFGLVRLHQGKGVLVSVLIPLAIAAAFEFVRKPTPAAWVLLVAVQISAVGVNPTAIWLLPLVVGCSLLAAARFDLRGWRTVILGGLTVGYPLSVGLVLRGGLVDRLERSVGALDGISLVARAARYVLGDGRLPTVMAFAVVAAWATVPRGPGRRLLVLLPLTALAIFNPWLAVPFASLATGASTFWRVLWLVPAPALLGIVATAPLALRGWPLPARAATSLAAVATLALGLPSIQLAGAGNRVRLAPFELKLPSPEGAVGRAVAELGSEQQPVLVPQEIGPWVTVWPHHPCPLMVRMDYLTFGDPEERKRRAFMAAWVSGAKFAVGDRVRFLEGLDHYRPSVVCLAPRHPAQAWWADQASIRGYRRDASVASYELWRRARTESTG